MMKTFLFLRHSVHVQWKNLITTGNQVCAFYFFFLLLLSVCVHRRHSWNKDQNVIIIIIIRIHFFCILISLFRTSLIFYQSSLVCFISHFIILFLIVTLTSRSLSYVPFFCISTHSYCSQAPSQHTKHGFTVRYLVTNRFYLYCMKLKNVSQR